jgi:hypothetical protein
MEMLMGSPLFDPHFSSEIRAMTSSTGAIPGPSFPVPSLERPSSLREKREQKSLVVQHTEAAT